MVLVAASLGLILYSVLGISGSESAIVALTALTFLILYNAVSMRLRDRTDVGGQIADLSRGTADLARQVAEFGRRLAAVEGRVVSANSAGADRIQTVIGEINELGVLYRFGPSRRAARWEWLSVGTLAAALLWVAGSSLLSWYLSNFGNYDATYGSLGAAIGLMMWMWMSAIIVLCGAELNSEIEHQTARDSTVGQPKPLGARGAVMADTLGPAVPAESEEH